MQEDLFETKTNENHFIYKEKITERVTKESFTFWCTPKKLDALWSLTSTLPYSNTEKMWITSKKTLCVVLCFYKEKVNGLFFPKS